MISHSQSFPSFSSWTPFPLFILFTSYLPHTYTTHTHTHTYTSPSSILNTISPRLSFLQQWELLLIWWPEWWSLGGCCTHKSADGHPTVCHSKTIAAAGPQDPPVAVGQNKGMRLFIFLPAPLSSTMHFLSNTSYHVLLLYNQFVLFLLSHNFTMAGISIEWLIYILFWGFVNKSTKLLLGTENEENPFIIIDLAIWWCVMISEVGITPISWLHPPCIQSPRILRGPVKQWHPHIEHWNPLEGLQEWVKQQKRRNNFMYLVKKEKEWLVKKRIVKWQVVTYIEFLFGSGNGVCGANCESCVDAGGGEPDSQH